MPRFHSYAGKGMIVVVAFECGPHAVGMDSLQVLPSQYGVPHLNLVLDEDTEEAGFVTRVRRKSRCSNLKIEVD